MGGQVGNTGCITLCRAEGVLTRGLLLVLSLSHQIKRGTRVRVWGRRAPIGLADVGPQHTALARQLQPGFCLCVHVRADSWCHRACVLTQGASLYELEASLQHACSRAVSQPELVGVQLEVRSAEAAEGFVSVLATCPANHEASPVAAAVSLVAAMFYPLPLAPPPSPAGLPGPAAAAAVPGPWQPAGPAGPAPRQPALRDSPAHSPVPRSLPGRHRAALRRAEAGARRDGGRRSRPGGRCVGVWNGEEVQKNIIQPLVRAQHVPCWAHAQAL